MSDPKRYRKDLELHDAWRRGVVSSTFANYIYDRIATLTADLDQARRERDALVGAVLAIEVVCTLTPDPHSDPVYDPQQVADAYRLAAALKAALTKELTNDDEK